eukprot:XP_001700835.1 predicted protein [Chlamydomonas reinhardtii]
MAAQQILLRTGPGSACQAHARRGCALARHKLTPAPFTGTARLQLDTPSVAPSVPFTQPSRASRTTSVFARASSSSAADAAPSQPPQEPASTPLWRTHISRKPILLQALYDCLAGLRAAGPLPDRDFPLLVEALRQQVPGLRNVFGCTGFGIIGVDGEGAHEVEAAAALSLTLASIPQAEVVCPLSFVVLADPTFGEVQGMGTFWMAWTSPSPPPPRLGCRPLTSTTWTVDRVAAGDPTRILALSAEGVARGRPLPALEAFQSVLGGMTETQLRRTVSNLTVGVAPEGLKPAAELEPQDFLIRALRGFDAEQALVVGDYMRAGQRLRFMVRDKQGAQEDLTSHGLAFKRKQLQPFGMLMFTCNGRGSGLYGEDSYDARTLSTYVPVPVAGFQCNGEIGRVGNTTHLHGFTCAAGVLRLTSEFTV